MEVRVAESSTRAIGYTSGEMHSLALEEENERTMMKKEEVFGVSFHQPLSRELFMNPDFHTGCFSLCFFFFLERAFIAGMEVRMNIAGWGVSVLSWLFTIFPGRHTLGDCCADWLASKEGSLRVT